MNAAASALSGFRGGGGGGRRCWRSAWVRVAPRTPAAEKNEDDAMARRTASSSSSSPSSPPQGARKRRRPFATASSSSPPQPRSVPSFRHRYLATLSTDRTHCDSYQRCKSRNDEEEIAVTRGGDDDDDVDDDFRPPRWLRKMQRRAASDRPMDSQKVYRYLGLKTFDEAECEDRFRAILRSGEGRLPPPDAAAAEKTAAATTTTTTTSDEAFDTAAAGYDEKTEAFFGSSSAAESAILTKDRLRSYLSETVRREEREHDEATTTRGIASSLSSSSSSSMTTTSDIDRLRTAYIEAETRQLWRFLTADGSGSGNGHRGAEEGAVTREEFVTTVRASATALDKQRLGPLALSMVMIGLSVGVTTPAFPFVVQNLGLTTGEYGMVVSAFALTKLMGNIPFAVLVERNGRKPYLVYSLVAISAGVGCIGLASGFEELYACRLVTGLGVAGLSCAATMSVTDISTPLNRASSFAPISAGFAAGTAMGPALGGVLIDELGVNPTFYLVGGSFLALGGINSVLLDETLKRKSGGTGFPWQRRRSAKRLAADTAGGGGGGASSEHGTRQQREGSPPPQRDDDDDPENVSIREAFRSALGQWAPLLSEAPVRNVCIVNAFYWVALAGGQMTLLPLLLTDPAGLAMTATQVGQVYMGMSFVQVFGNPIFAKVVDRVGAVPGIVGGCSMIGTAMYALPAVVASSSSSGDHRVEAMAAALALWAAGSSLLSTSPIAHITQKVDDSKRAQAIALLRTAGDVGFLVGASGVGMVAEMAGSLEAAMQSSAAILGTATSWYVARNVLTAREAAASAAATSTTTKRERPR